MSKRWYFAALVPLVIGGLIAGFAFMRLGDAIAAMPRMVVPGEHTFQLPAGDHIVFAESESTVDGTHYANPKFGVKCSLTADGAPVLLSSHSGKLTYSLGGYEGGAIFDFTLAKAAAVKLACETNDGKAVLAVGPSLAMNIVVAVVPLLIGLLGGIVTLFIVRKKRKRYLALVAARDNT